ncbi:MAG: o-succinylbenzoate--CoA ligase [Halobacteria archaeon]|nr:o-succinylbenzoate--CoA ligase [Halobacteria archaeon]
MSGSFYDPLAHRAEATPDKTAVIDAETDDRMSYAELDRRVDGLSRSLRRLGVDEDDHLGVVMETRVEYVSLVHASMRLNATLVPINARLTSSEVSDRVEAADVSAVVCDSETEDTVETDPDVSLATVDEPNTDSDSDSVTRLEAVSDPTPVRLSRDASETACIPFTSGTTGDPKPVCLSYGNFLTSATASAFRLGHLPDDRRLVCLPMYHMGGLSHVFRAALHGTAAVVQEGFDAEETVENIAEYGVTQVSLVPTTLRRILDTGIDTQLDSLRYVLLGGAPASEDLLRESREAGVRVCPTYGMTETASQISTVSPGSVFETEDEAETPGVGQPLVSTRVSILGDDGEPVKTGETGEIVVSGSTVTDGYYRLPDETSEAFCEYGLKTGDLGYRDETGRLYVVGRKDDVIITGGENVNPNEVTEILLEHPRLEDAGVIGVDDEEWGERICALVVPVDGDEVDVRGYCRERLAGYKCPRTVAFVDEIPRTESGTVDRAAARGLLGTESESESESESKSE